MGSRWTIALLLALPLALAEKVESQDTSRQRRPGIWHEGRFIGYQPAHEKLADQERPNTASHAHSNASISGRQSVEPAIFQESNIAETLPAPKPGEASINAPAKEATGAKSEVVCCGTPCWFGRAEYLLWWTRGMNVPALATTGDAGDGVPAALGQANTRILFGDAGLNDEARSGGRFTIGKWCDPCECSGVEFTYLGLGDKTESFSASSDDFAILGRPFFNTETAAEDVEYIGLPAALANGPITGTLDITATTEFQTLEALYRHAAMRCCGTRVDYLFGYRFAELEDRLRIDETTVSGAGNMVVFDQFDTRNTFHGVELGLACQQQCNPCWSWEGVAKVALGNTGTRAALTGETNGVAAGGLLVQAPTNLGVRELDEFGVLTEVGLSLRHDLHCGLTAVLGYSFLHWNTVHRAGEQVDRAVNPQQIIPPGDGTGALRPAFPATSSDFWAQGLRFGLEYNF